MTNKLHPVIARRDNRDAEAMTELDLKAVVRGRESFERGDGVSLDELALEFKSVDAKSSAEDAMCV